MLRPHENSLFALLLRSPWWASALVAVGLAGGLRLIIPDMFALFAGLPFAAIAAYVGWKQLRAPSAKKVAGTLERVRAMPWPEFADAMEAAFRREGYTVNRLGAQADFELVQGWRSTLVGCKRWKAMRTGIEPLRELDAARRAREAHGCIYVATGEITAQAAAFAAQKNIRLLHGAELARMLPR